MQVPAVLLSMVLYLSKALSPRFYGFRMRHANAMGKLYAMVLISSWWAIGIWEPACVRASAVHVTVANMMLFTQIGLGVMLVATCSSPGGAVLFSLVLAALHKAFPVSTALKTNHIVAYNTAGSLVYAVVLYWLIKLSYCLFLWTQTRSAIRRKSAGLGAAEESSDNNNLSSGPMSWVGTGRIMLIHVHRVLFNSRNEGSKSASDEVASIIRQSLLRGKSTPRGAFGPVSVSEVGVEVQADCICIVYLCVPVCVIEGGGGGASSTPGLKAPPVSKFGCETDAKHRFQLEIRLGCFLS